jgi:hypothetical protein
VTTERRFAVEARPRFDDALALNDGGAAGTDVFRGLKGVRLLLGWTQHSKGTLRMLTRDQALEMLRALQSLPGEKVAEVADFITYLRERYGQRAVDDSDVWTDEDLNDVVAASLAHAEESSSGER